jgi:hypothetical protein
MLQLFDISDLLWHPKKWMDEVEASCRDSPPSPTTPTRTEPEGPHEDHREDPGEDGGAEIIRLLCKVLDKTATSEGDRLQYETVSHLGDTSSAVRTHFWSSVVLM